MNSMAEPKRLQFTTVEPPNNEEKKKTPQIYQRFTLSLSASTDTTCPEFSYTELLKNRLKEKKNPEKPQNDGPKNGDPFGDDEDADEIAAIARRFEEKYGHTDLGEGYDETDEFIDNSEAYDEVVPSYLTTKLGGFYINSGKLDFKEVSDDSREEFQAPIKKKKKRVISSDSDSDEDEKKKKIKKRKLKEGINGEKKKKKHLMNGDAEKPFKKPKKPIDKEKVKKKKISPTVAELLKQQTESTSNTSSIANGVAISDMDVNSPNDSNDSSSDAVITNKEDSNSRDVDDDKKAVDPTTIPKLPTGIPSELEQTIDKLKEAAKNSSVGKSKFFTNVVNKMLLDVEMGCRQLSCGQRSSIYAHLAVYLPCGKETLKTRAKKLRENMETDLLREPMQKLREAIGKVMPSLLEKYEVECQKFSQARSQEKEKEEQREEKDEIEDNENEEKSTTDASKKKMPPKKFEWNNEIRVLLCEVVRIKLKIYDSSKTRVQGAEEFLKAFLDREIKPLWPKGWMQTRALFKESKSAHAAWTIQKPKKNVIITKTTPSAGSVQNTPETPKSVTPGVAVVKTPVNNNDISIIKDKSTPTQPAAAKSNVPTILDYAEKEISKKLMSQVAAMATAKAAKSDSALSSGGENTATAGLSLLAASAAKQQYLEKSWDHVVSDILRSSLQASDKKVSPTAPKTPSGGDTGSSFLAAFEKYASSAFESKLKDPKVGADTLGSSVAKQLSAQLQHGNQKLNTMAQTQNQSSNQDMRLQQQKAVQLLQNKQVMDKLKMVSQQKIENKQMPASGQAQQRVVKSIKISPQQQQQLLQKVGQSGQKTGQQGSPQQQQQQLLQKVSQSGQKTGQQGSPQQQQQQQQQLLQKVSQSGQKSGQQGQAIISVTSASKVGNQHVSLLNQDHLYKKLLLESGVQGLSQFQSPSNQTSPTTVKNAQNVPATFILTGNSGKTPQQHKVTTVSLTKVASSSQNSGTLQRMSPGSQVKRTSPLSGQRSSQVQNTSSVASLISGNNVSYSGSNGQSRNSAGATNLLQQLMESNSSHSLQKQSISAGGMQGSPQKSSQGKAGQPQIWSMSSMVTSANSGSKSMGYSVVTQIPKPVPGYQSVRIGNLAKDPGTASQMQRTGVHGLYQGSYGSNQTSPVSSGQQSPLGHPGLIPGQTSPLQRQQSHELFPPYTTNSHQQPQHHQTSYPTANYRSYAEKSRSPHGY